MKYNGVALSDQFEGGRKGIEIEILHNEVTVQMESEILRWPIHSIKLEKGGSGNQLIYLKHAGDSTITIYTRDKSILKNERILNDPLLNETSKELRYDILKNRTAIVLVVLVILAIPLTFFIFRTTVVKRIADQVPVEWEVEAGDKLFSTLESQYRIIQDSSISAKLDSLFRPLTAAAQYEAIEFKFFLADDPTLNAFALPGGYVVINTGTIDKIERIEELYGVMGHELAHVTERHHLRGLIGNLGMFVILQGMFGGEAGVIGSLGESAGQLSSLFYSRGFETESDLVGYEYMKDANIDPTGMVEFFERIQYEYVDDESSSEEGEDGTMEDIQNFLSTHPGTEERIDYLLKKIEKEGKTYQELDYDVKELQDFIHSKLN